ncbi:Ubiquilin-4 [Babesia sp. Xinjiang]|uniref:Ubiquilin-4 n=1 Tax=Babesia sp. Xinjiang TaxID=462227 RepID=UPI000A25B83E|nr:Ubiquilin-4 [Babesia sp. Xinjiang]ORM42178.1 Ubiquilin-4 [Babesia sp. Xinjiang]
MADQSQDELAKGHGGGKSNAGKNTIDEQVDKSSTKRSCKSVDVIENVLVNSNKDCDEIQVDSLGDSLSPEVVPLDENGPKAAEITTSVSAEESSVSTDSLPQGSNTSGPMTRSKASGSRHDYERTAGSVISHFTRRLVTDTANIDVDQLVESMEANQSAPPSEEDADERMRMNETNRMLRELTSDSELMSQVMRAATNPEMAKELARQADTAWRNIEALPGGFRALCQMHRNIQQPLWHAMMDENRRGSVSKNYEKAVTPKPTQKLTVETFPNPWATPPSMFSPSPNFGLNDGILSAPMSGLGNLLSAIPASSSQNSSGNNSPGNLNLMSALQPYLAGLMRNPSNSSRSASSAVGTSNDPQSVTPESSSTEESHPTVTASSSTEPIPAEAADLSSATSEVKYAKELEQMLEMGIEDRELCLTVLEASDGDIFAAIDLLQSLREADGTEPREDA